MTDEPTYHYDLKAGRYVFDVTYVDAGDGYLDVLNATGDPLEYGLTLAEAEQRYGVHPVRTLAWVAEHEAGGGA